MIIIIIVLYRVKNFIQDYFYLIKKVNPNQSLVTIIWFGLHWVGAGDWTRTSTLLRVADFESAASAIPPHRQGWLSKKHFRKLNLFSFSQMHPQ